MLEAIMNCTTTDTASVGHTTADWRTSISLRQTGALYTWRHIRPVNMLHALSTDLCYQSILLRCFTIARWRKHRPIALRDQKTQTRSLSLIARWTAVVHNRLMALYTTSCANNHDITRRTCFTNDSAHALVNAIISRLLRQRAILQQRRSIDLWRKYVDSARIANTDRPLSSSRPLSQSISMATSQWSPFQPSRHRQIHVSLNSSHEPWPLHSPGQPSTDTNHPPITTTSLAHQWINPLTPTVATQVQL